MDMHDFDFDFDKMDCEIRQIPEIPRRMWSEHIMFRMRINV